MINNNNNKDDDIYDPKKYAFSDIDQNTRCTNTNIVICPKCKAKGHPKMYIDSARKGTNHNNGVEMIGADQIIHHGHFILDLKTLVHTDAVKHKGRNVWCVIKKGMIPLSDCKISYTYVGRKLPHWARKRFDEHA